MEIITAIIVLTADQRLFDLNSSKKPTSNIGKHKKEDNIKLEIMQGI